MGDLFRPFQSNSYRGLTLPLIEKGGAVRHVFGLRGPDPLHEIGRKFGISEEDVLSFHQVHGDAICVLKSSPGKPSSSPKSDSEFDALMTDCRGVVLAINTADCVPILLWDPVRKVSGAVHAGWRGSLSEIVSKTISRMEEAFGSAPEMILAGIGPSASPCCYEVDGAVLDPIKKKFHFWEDVIFRENKGRGYLDLVELNRRQLINSGLREKHIQAAGACTICHPERFSSFRRDKTAAGRMISGIMIL